jgi:hypothetical protein
MNAKLKIELFEIHYQGMIVEIQDRLATVYKPRETMGERLGSFSTKGMTVDELIDKVETFKTLI